MHLIAIDIYFIFIAHPITPFLGGFFMLLIINELGKTTKIVPKMFGSFTFFSYVYIVNES